MMIDFKIGKRYRLRLNDPYREGELELEADYVGPALVEWEGEPMEVAFHVFRGERIYAVHLEDVIEAEPI